MKNELIIFAAAIALLAGCSKEEGAPAAERPCIRLSTGVEAATRATDVAFEEGDNFGLIVPAARARQHRRSTAHVT